MLKPTILESPNWSFTSFYRVLEEKRLCAKVHMINITSFLFHKNWFIFEVSNAILKNLALCRMMRLMNVRQALCHQAKLPAPNRSDAVITTVEPPAAANLFTALFMPWWVVKTSAIYFLRKM